MIPFAFSRPKSHLGYTLVEMLVALTASLILFGVVMSIFGVLGEAVSQSRQVGELESQLCTITTTLREDLAGVTAVKNPNGLVTSPDSGSATGYFEIIEGPSSDVLSVDPSSGTVVDKSEPLSDPPPDVDNRLVGDVDDLLFFTVASVRPDPFIGKFLDSNHTAREAEIAYFCTRTPNTSNPELYTLHRRQLLITAGATPSQFNEQNRYMNQFTTWANFYNQFDISARRETELINGNEENAIFLNTASDLQIRRNRLGHDPAQGENVFFTYPHSDNLYPVANYPNNYIAEADDAQNQVSPIFPPLVNPNSVLPLSGPRAGEDVIADNVLSFDVRVLDPHAQERGPFRLHPSDPGYWVPGIPSYAATSPVYVDLGYSGFSILWTNLYGDSNPVTPTAFSDLGGSWLKGDAFQQKGRTYDTWTTFYQDNGIDEGYRPSSLDDDPPYSAPLAGIQVTIRLYDANSKSVRQRTIVHSFTE